MSQQGPRLLVNAEGRLVPPGSARAARRRSRCATRRRPVRIAAGGHGEPQLLTEHLARMARFATAMDLPLPPAGQWRRCLDAAVQAWTGGPEMAVRLIVTRGTLATGMTSYLLAEPVSPTALAQRTDGCSALTLERGLGRLSDRLRPTDRR